MKRIIPFLLVMSAGVLRGQDIGQLIKEGNEALGAEVKTWGAAAQKAGLDNRECKPVKNLFGVKPLRLLGTLGNGKFVRIDALLINQGVGFAVDTFETEYSRLQTALPEAISQALDGEAAVPSPVPPGAAPESQAWMWCAPQEVITVTFEPHKRVILAVRPITEVETKEADARRRKIEEEKFNSRVTKRENGDVVIEGLPSVEAAKDGVESPLRLVALLQKYFGWKADMPAFWKRMDGAAGDGSIDEILLTEITKEAGAPMTHLRSFDQETAMAEISKGRLVVVRRAYQELRQVFLRDFNQRFSKDPSLTLPVSSPQEMKKWAVAGTAPYAFGTLIVGFNRKRGEFLITQAGWFQPDQEMRIRFEELKAGVYDMFFFSSQLPDAK